VYIYICVCIYVCVYIYIYNIYIHTRMHTELKRAFQQEAICTPAIWRIWGGWGFGFTLAVGFARLGRVEGERDVEGTERGMRQRWALSGTSRAQVERTLSCVSELVMRSKVEASAGQQNPSLLVSRIALFQE